MLDLNQLDTDDIPGVLREKGISMAQAAAVCLESQGHVQGVQFSVEGDYSGGYQIVWTPVTLQAWRTWYDPDEATEEGAAGIATLLADQEIGHKVILRSRKGTGFDYWLGNNDLLNASDAELKATAELGQLLWDDNLIVRARMEVSGILNGTDSRVRERIREKVDQMGRSDYLNLPAYAIVIEFGSPRAEVRKK